MARSFSNNAKLLSALVVDGFSTAISRRGYAVGASSQGVVNNMVKKSGEKMTGSTEKVSWIPDPKTGYYKPETFAQEIDPAELRATLLKKH